MPSLAHRYLIELQDVAPPVWRQIQVPADYSFWDLHVAIQDAMGWLDYHLHLFTREDPNADATVEIGIPNPDAVAGADGTEPGWEVPIVRLFQNPGDSFAYIYDFGDYWCHTVTLEQIAEVDAPLASPVCLDGSAACPPEDCGGPPGYAHLLKVLKNPKHPEFTGMSEWLGRSFDAAKFEPSQVKFDDPKKRWKLAFDDQ